MGHTCCLWLWTPCWDSCCSCSGRATQDRTSHYLCCSRSPWLPLWSGSGSPWLLLLLLLQRLRLRNRLETDWRVNSVTSDIENFVRREGVELHSLFIYME